MIATTQEITSTINISWLLLSGFLVVLMQAGFTCLESGMVRAKNSINVAIKNLVDFCISNVLFVLVGFGIMFGASVNGLFGSSYFFFSGDFTPFLGAFFFFQAMFCGTATTIVSGAVAERMRFSGYCITAVVISAIIYPVAGHWAWAGAESGAYVGWLGAKGFIDFAGSTVVHSVAGWMALAAIIVLGPRIGRFGPEGRPIEGHSLPIATLGVFLLWFGWFGFNGGSTFALNGSVPKIIINTALAGATGGLAALALTWRLMGKPVVDRIINGVIAGLVAITASANLMTPPLALLVGAVGGVVCVLGMKLLERLEIDDAIGAVPAHLFAGVWGTLAVALLAPEGSWGTGLTRSQQLGAQLEGIVAIGAYSFLVGYALLRLVNIWLPLRVTPDDERIGLNISEHGASTATLDLIMQMDRQARLRDFSKPVEVEPETEASRISKFYNAVLEGFNLETGRSRMAMRKLSQLANYDSLTGLANRRLFFEAVRRALARVKRSGGAGTVLYFDLDGFKNVNDTMGHECGDLLLKEVARRIANLVREEDILARIGGDEFCLLVEGAEGEMEPQVIAEKVLHALAEPVELGGGRATVGISIGIIQFDSDHAETDASLVRKADLAMYAAKLAGKGVYRFYEGQDESAPAPDV